MILDIDFGRVDTKGNCPALSGYDFDAMQIRNILSLHKREWFKNLNQGIDWLSFQSKNPDNTLLEGSIKLELKRYGYSSISQFVLTIDPRKRKGNITLSIRGTLYQEEIKLP